ncbi:MAG: sugar transferase [bacterium]|nr:sugar transferase [bacterium]
MKKSELIFTAILVPLDFLMLMLAGVSAYYIRFAEMTAEIRPVIFNLPFEEYFKILLLVSAAWIIIFSLAGLYKITISTKIIDEIYKIILACSTGLVAVIIFMFFQRELFSSRFIILASWILAIIYVVVARVVVRKLQRNFYARGIGTHKVVIIGNTPATERLIQLISTSNKLGLNIVKRYKYVDENVINDLKETAKNRLIDEIIQIDPNLSNNEVLQLLAICDEYHIIFKYAADMLGTKILKTEVHMIAGLPIVEIKNTPLDGWGKINKRIFDIVFSAVFIVLLSPIYLITAILIKFESKGPVIYKNERVSKDGYFNVYKFRSMRNEYCVGNNNPEALSYEQELIARQNTKDGPVYKIGNDPRITKIGRVIRRWSIDELPQFFNVFLGNMSLVGPRPHQPREVDKYNKNHKKVLAIKPGVTGLAQISGRSDLSFDEEVRLDVYYIENWSLLRDVAILVRTPIAVLRQRKVE